MRLIFSGENEHALNQLRSIFKHTLINYDFIPIIVKKSPHNVTKGGSFSSALVVFPAVNVYLSPSSSSFIITLHVIIPKENIDVIYNVPLFYDAIGFSNVPFPDQQCLAFSQCTATLISIFNHVAQLDVEFVVLPVFQHMLYPIHAAYIHCFL